MTRRSRRRLPPTGACFLYRQPIHDAAFARVLEQMAVTPAQLLLQFVVSCPSCVGRVVGGCMRERETSC